MLFLLGKTNRKIGVLNVYQQMLKDCKGTSNEIKNENGTWSAMYYPIVTEGKQTVVFALEFSSVVIYKELYTLMVEKTVIGLLISGIFLVLIVSLLQRLMMPLKRLVEITNQWTNGDLTITVEQDDEIGRLSNSINSIIMQIWGLVSHVKTMADEVTMSSN